MLGNFGRAYERSFFYNHCTSRSIQLSVVGTLKVFSFKLSKLKWHIHLQCAEKILTFTHIFKRKWNVKSVIFYKM